MKIQDALLSLNAYPTPINAITKICIDRGMDASADYNSTVASSDSFQLASADLYSYLSNAPDLNEQESYIKTGDRKLLKEQAQRIYGLLGDNKFTGQRIGFIGDLYNG